MRRKKIISDSSSESEDENPKYVNKTKGEEGSKKKPKSVKRSTPPKKSRKTTKNDDNDFIEQDISGNENDDYVDNSDTELSKKRTTPSKKKVTTPSKKKKVSDDESSESSSGSSGSESSSGSSGSSYSSSGSSYTSSSSSSSRSASESESEHEPEIEKEPEPEKPKTKAKAKPKEKQPAKTKEKPQEKPKEKPSKEKTSKEKTSKTTTPRKRSTPKKSDEYEEIGATKGSKRWETLVHNGPLFPPEYVPHGVPLIYDGKAIKLPPEIEEVASFYARYLETDHVKKEVFNKNFFTDFRNFMKETKHTDLYKQIQKFELCDFGKIHAHLMEESERRKIKTKEEKLRDKELKEKDRLKYGIAIINGKEQRIGNYTIEPPGLFLGRGSHPKTGMLKRRVMPEMVTINVSKGHTPECPMKGHTWGKVICDDHVTWLATWHENIHGRCKYVWLHATSSIKGASDQHKYEVARKLKDKIGGIRDSYTKDLSSDDMFKRQRATALWLIDKLALRVGGEKGEDEADTVGCCSLRVEHVAFPKDRPKVVCFDFLGKDSMRFQKDVEVPPAIYKNLKSFADKPKKSDDELFDLLSTTNLNEYLKTFMDGLTAKVFRTYNASFTLQEELRKPPANFDKMSVNEKVLFYNSANKQVAILCNHQKTVKQNVFSAAIGGIKEQIIELVKQKKMVAAQIKKLGGKVPRKAATKTSKPPKKKKWKKEGEEEKEEEEGDDDDFESDNEGKSKKRKTAKKTTGKKGKKSKKDEEEEEEEEERDEENDDDEVIDDDLKALININENDIKEDDPDIIEYRKTKEERMKIKAARDKLIQEKEIKMMKEKVKKEEEDDDDDDYEDKVKKEPIDDDDDEDEVKPAKKSKSKAKASPKSKVKVKKEEVSDDEDDDDKDKKKKGKGSKKETASKSKKSAVEELPVKVKKEEKEDNGFVVPTSLPACMKKYNAILEKIDKLKAKMVEKGELRNVALGTSKINYMDPRITVAWCKRAGVPLERVFQKTLREKFTWALDVEEDFDW